MTIQWKFLCCFVIGALLLTSGVPRTYAESSSSSSSSESAFSIDACRTEINNRLGQEQRVYRSVLFGVKKATDEALGVTRYDAKGTAWIKTAEDEWKTASSDERPRDDWIDKNAEMKERRGIFDSRGILTSELIPHLTVSYRALGCQLDKVCEAARLSMGSSGLTDASSFTVKVRGCIAFKEVRPLQSCQLAPEGQSEPPPEINARAFVQEYCQDVAPKILEREAELLKLAVSYDAAYRTLLQFAGNFEQFAGSFRVSLLTPIRQAMSLMGYLHRIPCFLSQCDE